MLQQHRVSSVQVVTMMEIGRLGGQPIQTVEMWLSLVGIHSQ